MTDPLDPMLPVEPGSQTDRILRDHRAMEAMRSGRITLSAFGPGPVRWHALYRDHIRWIERFADNPADACAAAIEAASTDSRSS